MAGRGLCGRLRIVMAAERRQRAVWQGIGGKLHGARDGGPVRAGKRRHCQRIERDDDKADPGMAQHAKHRPTQTKPGARVNAADGYAQRASGTRAAEPTTLEAEAPSSSTWSDRPSRVRPSMMAKGAETATPAVRPTTLAAPIATVLM